jgi:hypothetical protein
MKPSIGRIVHVLVDPQTNNGSDVAPAMITRVWSDTCVNIRVSRDNHPGPEEWLTSISLYDSLDALESSVAQRQAEFDATGQEIKAYRGGAFWPPRVEHQPGDRPQRF